MKFSFFIINQTPEGSDMKQVYDEGMEQIEWGDQLGYEGMFMAEHAFYHHGKVVALVALAHQCLASANFERNQISQQLVDFLGRKSREQAGLGEKFQRPAAKVICIHIPLCLGD